MSVLVRFNDVLRDLTRTAMAARKGRGDDEGYRALKGSLAGVPRASAEPRERFVRDAPGAAATGHPAPGDRVLAGVADAELAELVASSERFRADLRRLAGLARLPVGASVADIERVEDAVAEGVAIADLEIPEAPAAAAGDEDELLASLEGTSLGELAKELARDLGAGSGGEPDLPKMMSAVMSKMAAKIGSGELDHSRMFGEAMSLMSGPLAGKIGGMPDLSALAGALGGAKKKTSGGATRRRNDRRQRRHARNADPPADAPDAGGAAE